MEKIAAVLIAAHVIADFALQPSWLAFNKHRLRYLISHAAIHAVCAYVGLQAWTCWQAPVLILVLHAVIDAAKQRWGRDTAGSFVTDQIAHVLSLLAVAWLLVRVGWLPAFAGHFYRPLIVLAGLVATVQGAGFLIGAFTRRLIEENQLLLHGLRNGGRLIGQLERALIFLFILIGPPEGIGFLVAAKSILRFEEAKRQDLAEYVLIGTLCSFSLAISLASATKWAIGL